MGQAISKYTPGEPISIPEASTAIIDYISGITSTVQISGTIGEITSIKGLTVSGGTIGVETELTGTISLISPSSTIQAQWTATQPVIISTTSTYPVSFAITSTIQAIPIVVKTSTILWNNESIPSNGTSPSIDLYDYKNISVLVNTSTETDITIQVSRDNSTWYNHEILSFTASGNVGLDIMWSGRYYRLMTSNASTLTAEMIGKT
jgi:hypothetical protein